VGCDSVEVNGKLASVKIRCTLAVANHPSSWELHEANKTLRDFSGALSMADAHVPNLIKARLSRTQFL
jgi:hypothetical protein